MKSGRTLQILLALAFVMGQMLALAHATGHELLGRDHATCGTCVLAHAAPVPPAPALSSVQIVPQSAPEPLPCLTPGDRRPFERANTRGPPILA